MAIAAVLLADLNQQSLCVVTQQDLATQQNTVLETTEHAHQTNYIILQLSADLVTDLVTQLKIALVHHPVAQLMFYFQLVKHVMTSKLHN